MTLKGQRPQHPGRVADVRGLDQVLWALCLRCWELDSNGPATIQEIVDVLASPRCDILRCPFEWDIPSLRAWTARSAPPFDRQIRVVQKVEAGRDVENRAYERVGTLKRGRDRLVNILSPNDCRRGTLRAEHVSSTHIYDHTPDVLCRLSSQNS